MTQNKEKTFRKFVAAVEKGDIVTMADSFVKEFIDTEANEMGWRPLHLAAFHGQSEAVNWLLQNGADARKKDNTGWLPIHRAAQQGHINVMENLVVHGADVNCREEKYRRTPMHIAAAEGQSSAMEWLQQMGGDVNSKDLNGRTPLHRAAGWKQMEVINWLLKDDSCVEIDVEDERGYRPVDWANWWGQREAVDALLKRTGEESSNLKIDAFAAAIRAGNTDEIKKLLEFPKANVDEQMGKKGATGMHLAAGIGHVDVLRLLVKRGGNVEAETKDGWRPLHVACARGSDEAAQWLVSTAGCVLDTRNADGWLPIEEAKRRGYSRCVRVVEEEQERRQKDEFQIFHLKAMTVICRKYKICDLQHTMRKVQENVTPLNKPIVFYDSILDKRCFRQPLEAVAVASDRTLYEEHIVVHKLDNAESMESINSQIGDWNADFTICKEQSAVSETRLWIKPKNIDAKWTHRCSLSLELHEEGSTNADDAIIRMLLPDTVTVKEIKTIFIASMKLFYSDAIHKPNESLENAADRRNSCEGFGDREKTLNISLKKLLLMSMKLLTFYDKQGRKLESNNDARWIVDRSDGCVCVEHKYVGQMEFIHGTTDKMTSFASEDAVVAVCVTEEGSSLAMLRKDYQSAKDIRNAIAKHINSGSGDRILLLSDANSQIIDDDVGIADVDDVIRYFVISRFDEGQSGIKIKKIIGRGAGGGVRKCCVGTKKDRLAIKQIVVTERNKKETCANVIKEILVACRIGRHPRVMKYLRFFEDKFTFYILMHRMETSLTAYVYENKPLSEAKVIFFTKQILEGVDYLHDNKIIHRDIKGSNILLDKDDNIKLTDFGIAKCLDIVSKDAQQTGAVSETGTHNYMAPEMIDKDYGLKVDIWSVGATLVEMITGYAPFHGLRVGQIIIKLNTERKIPYEYPSGFHDDLWEFVDLCLTADQNERPDCKTLLGHSIFMTHDN